MSSSKKLPFVCLLALLALALIAGDCSDDHWGHDFTGNPQLLAVGS